MKLPFRTFGILTALLFLTTGASSAAVADEGHAVRPSQAAGVLSPLSRRDNQAVIALLESAAQELKAGRLEHASDALERALRIDPRNAAVWHYLGQTRLHQGQYQDAESLALKSDALAGDDAALRARNAWLVEAARQAAGQGLTPSIDDSEQLALQNRLDEEIERRRHAEAEAEALRQRLEQEQPQRRQAETSNPARISPLREQVAPETGRDKAVREGRPERFVIEEIPGHDPRDVALEEGYGRELIDIPPGHRPPPGRCRIWFPDRPPGHQPPPGDCRALRHQVPAGARLVGH